MLFVVVVEIPSTTIFWLKQFTRGMVDEEGFKFLEDFTALRLRDYQKVSHAVFPTMVK